MTALSTLAEGLASGAVSSAGLTEAALAAAREDRAAPGAFTELLADSALALAYRADAERARGGPCGPLHGIPVAVKDNIDIAGVPTRNGTEGLGHRVPDEDAAVAGALRRAGAVLIGKTRLHELAWGMVTPGCGNPWDATRSPGGSSGGSAAAVAAGLLPLALGTDTGGSVRQPAALCGVVGLRPTQGRLPLDGVSPLAPSQDTVGLITRDSGDCRAAFAALTGTAADEPPRDPRSVRVGLPTALWRTRAAQPVTDMVARTAHSLGEAGFDVAEVALPDAPVAVAASLVVMLAESARHWAAQAEAEDGASPELRSILRTGTRVREADYLRARRVSTRLRAFILDLPVDLLLLPTTAVAAAPREATDAEVLGRREPVNSAYARFTALASVTGLPALSVPAGLDPAGLPLGAQLIGRPGAELLLCAVGAAIEATPGGRMVAERRTRLPVALPARHSPF